MVSAEKKFSEKDLLEFAGFILNAINSEQDAMKVFEKTYFAWQEFKQLHAVGQRLFTILNEDEKKNDKVLANKQIAETNAAIQEVRQHEIQKYILRIKENEFKMQKLEWEHEAGLKGFKY
jgi:hypothetical protein